MLAVVVAGGLGALMRYAVSGWVHRIFGPSFPTGTLVVNIVGCFLIGVLFRLAETGAPWPPEWRAAVFVGFLGAFTTFSTFGYETLALLRDSEFGLALLNIGLQLLVGLAAVWLGHLAATLLRGMPA